MDVHLVFDLIAALAALTLTAACYRWRLAPTGAVVDRLGVPYGLALVAGAAAGGYLFGSLNLWLSGVDGLGRSILGALAGAIAAVELYKTARGIKGSTGLLFVPAFATSIAVGRIGCFLSGLEDQTHGIASTLPWAHDFGDGVLRHPVQIYESLAMAGFLVVTLVALARRSPTFMRNGFYLMTAWYAAQRFGWEFLKPYATVVGPFNIFHLLSLALLVYAAVMMKRTAR